jgi:hypothetical protein
MNSIEKIRALNDALRNLTGEGHIYVTPASRRSAMKSRP